MTRQDLPGKVPRRPNYMNAIFKNIRKAAQKGIGVRDGNRNCIGNVIIICLGISYMLVLLANI